MSNFNGNNLDTEKVLLWSRFTPNRPDLGGSRDQIVAVNQGPPSSVIAVSRTAFG